MSLTKRDFIALADTLRPLIVSGLVVDLLADFCRSQNPRFNEARWRAYLKGECGPSGGAVGPRRTRSDLERAIRRVRTPRKV
jgi:hypothetical protein